MPSKTHRLADPITSEDHAQGEPDAAELLNVLRVLPVRLEVEEADAFAKLILDAARA